MLKYNFKNLNFTFCIIAVILILATYALLYYHVGSNYLPVWSDEFFYYGNAASFFQNNTLQAALTFNGTGSRLIGADAHGFAYPLLNGGIAKIVGWHNLNFIYTNIGFILASLILGWFQKNINLLQKLLVTIFVLLFPFFLLYGFTYMQESIHIFFAIVCSILIFRINKEGKSKDYILFIFIIFVAAMFRPLWFFWLIALIPFAKNKFQKNLFWVVFLLGIIASFGVTYFFAEPVPNYFSSIINLLHQGNVKDVSISLAKHFVYNVYAYFFSTNSSFIYLLIRYLILMPFVIFFIKAIKYRSKLYTSIAFVGALNFFMLFLFYDVFGWREIRVLAPFFYFCILYLITETNCLFRYAQFVILTIVFVIAIPLSKKWILERNMHLKNEVAKSKTAYNLISNEIEDNSTVLINYTPSDSTLDLINIPFKNAANSPIKYIVPYYNLQNLKYDYILSKPNLPVKGRLIISNQYYQLERNY